MQQPEEDRTTSAASHADNAPANETRARVREAVERDWNDVREHPRREVSPVPAYLALAAAFALGFVLGRQFFLGAARPPRRPGSLSLIRGSKPRDKGNVFQVTAQRDIAVIRAA